MLTFYSEDSRLRQARTELHDGALVTPFECPERLDLVLNQLRQAKLGDIRTPLGAPPGIRARLSPISGQPERCAVTVFRVRLAAS